MAIVDIGGALAHVDLSTPLGLCLYRYGCRTVETRVMMGLLRRNDVFIDGGANIGTFSLIAATIVGSGGPRHRVRTKSADDDIAQGKHGPQRV